MQEKALSSTETQPFSEIQTSNRIQNGQNFNKYKPNSVRTYNNNSNINKFNNTERNPINTGEIF